MKTLLFFSVFLFFNLLALAQREGLKQRDSISVSFDYNRFQVKSEKNFLKRINQPNAEVNRIYIIAYTDSVGTTAYNQQLASKRLLAVYNLVLKSPWKNYKIDTVNANETAGTRVLQDARNRRVDVLFFTEKKPVPAVADDIQPVLNKVINLNVNFEGGKDVFLTTAYPNLNKLLNIMLEDTALRVQLDGHVCCADDYNLSLARARAVQRYLIDYGVDPKRIKAFGYSNSRRLEMPENTEEKRSRNRRVEAILSR